MINILLGKKVDQTQKFLQNGKRVPVTAISIEDNIVLQVKTIEKDSYSAVQLGVGVKKKSSKAAQGHVDKLGIKEAPLKIKELRIDSENIDKVPQSGSIIALESVFKPGDIVAITGTSKGKGFAGVVKRHGFGGGPKTHGQSDRHRAPGSIGQGTTPGRVYKGKRMAGRMGSDQVTISNLVVVDVDQKAKILYVAGLVPGNKAGWVYVRLTGEKKDFAPLFSIKADEDPGDTEEKIDSSDETVESEEVVEAAEKVPDQSEAIVVESDKEEPVDVKAESPKKDIEAINNPEDVTDVNLETEVEEEKKVA